MIATLEDLDRGVGQNFRPKNALTKQYKALFEMDGVNLDFRDDALKAIAERQWEKLAHGAAFDMENILMNPMFEIPTATNIQDVVINEDVVTGKTPPLMVYTPNAKEPKPEKRRCHIFLK